MSTSNGPINRPFKYGQNDRREFIVQDSEISLVCINDTDGDPIYVGRAKSGTGLGVAKWQIRYLQYDSAKGVIRMQWPINPDGSSSTDYEFIWTGDTALTITNITQANPALVTVSSIGNLVNGDIIVIQDVVGMTEVNFTGSNQYTVANIAGTDFELQGIDSTGFGAYTSGGTVPYGDFLNYTYA